MINDLVTKFSFTGSTQPLADFTSSLSSGIGLVFGFDKGLVGLAQSATAFVRDIVGSVDPLAQLSKETGVAVSAMQELGFAASQNGSNINDVTSSIEGLSAKIAEASISGSEDFARLGLSIRGSNGDLKTADVMLDDVRKRFKQLGLSMQQQKTLASSLGISDGLIQTLNLTDEAMGSLRNRARELGVTTKEESEAFMDLNNSFESLGFVTDSFKRSLAVGLAPAMKSITDTVVNFVAENKDLIITITKVVAISAALVGVLITVKAIVLALASPFILVAAAIAAVVLVVEDLYTWFSGGDSVIKGWIDSFMQMKEIKILIDSIGSAWQGFTGSIGSFFGFGGESPKPDTSSRSSINSNSSNVSQDVVVNINASNAEQAKSGVMQALDLQKQLQSASFQSSGGGI